MTDLSGESPAAPGVTTATKVTASDTKSSTSTARLIGRLSQQQQRG